MRARLLFVEDEEAVAAPLAEALREAGFEVTMARSHADARALPIDRFDGVLLDWNLPDGSGLDLLRAWRNAGARVPVIMLTARVEVSDRVRGLDAGAIDYVTKPFYAEEVIARLRRHLSGDPPKELRLGGLSVNLGTREAHYRSSPIVLTRKEFDLLVLLLEQPGVVFTREELLNRVWGYQSYPTTRTVDTHVLNLRQRIHPKLISTVRGIGYALARDFDEDLTEA